MHRYTYIIVKDTATSGMTAHFKHIFSFRHIYIYIRRKNFRQWEPKLMLMDESLSLVPLVNNGVGARARAPTRWSFLLSCYPPSILEIWHGTVGENDRARQLGTNGCTLLNFWPASESDYYSSGGSWIGFLSSLFVMIR